MLVTLGSGRTPVDPVAGPETPELGAVDGELTHERAEFRVVGIAPGLQAQHRGGVGGDLSPVGVELAGVRVEDKAVFDATHALVRRLAQEFLQVWKPEWDARLDTLDTRVQDAAASAESANQAAQRANSRLDQLEGRVQALESAPGRVPRG